MHPVDEVEIVVSGAEMAALLIDPHYAIQVAKVRYSFRFYAQIAELLHELESRPRGHPRIIQLHVEEEGRVLAPLQIIIG